MKTWMATTLFFAMAVGWAMGSLLNQPPFDENKPALRQSLLFDQICLPQFKEECKEICAREDLPLVRIDRIKICGVTTPTCLCGGRVLCTENDFQEIKLVVGCTNETRLPHRGSPYDADCNRLSVSQPCAEVAAEWPMTDRYSSRKSDLLMDSRLVPEHLSFWSGLSDGSGWCHVRDDWYVAEEELSLRSPPAVHPVRRLKRVSFDKSTFQWKPKMRLGRRMKRATAHVFVNDMYELFSKN